MAKIIILGAGLTGISTAYHLEKAGFDDYVMYEKENEAGGLCRSIEQDGFTFDYTGHLLHSNNEYFSNLLNSIVGLSHFNIINRKSFIYSNKTYTNYPYQSNLYGLPPDLITNAIIDFINKPTKIKKNPNFYEWALFMFGKTITEQFFVPYQQKIFDYDIKKLSSSWTSRFVPQTNLIDIIKGSLTPSIQNNIGYNAHFLYPKQGGIFFWVKKLIQQVKKPIKTKYCVESIDIKNKIVTFTNGDFEHFEKLISTLPLTTLIKLIKEKSSSSLKKAESKLLCNSVLNFNLGIQNENLSEKHWIYLPESEFPHYRIGFYHNFSQAMTPVGCSSVYGEYAYLNKDKNEISKKVNEAITSTKKLLSISDAQVITERIIHIPHAYVIYNDWRDVHVPKILERLESYNIHSIGRYGAWKYSSMQEAVLDGKLMAENITHTAEINTFYELKRPKKELQ